MWVIILLKKFYAIFSAFLFIIPFNCYAADNSATSAVVMDADTKIVLYEKNAYENRSMASTTKIMTALLAIESGMLDKTVKITHEMVATEGSSLGIKPDDTITLYDLIVGMMLTSGNDSANAVAYFISDSIEEFAVLMNERAKKIGMDCTTFVTPSGLDDGDHHSTAYDMALLASEAVKNDIFNRISAMKSADITISGKKVTVYNHNKLLSYDESFCGVKTGYTKKAGRCLVSAKNYEGNKLICVTLNAPDDWNDHMALMKECESRYIKRAFGDKLKINAVGGEKDVLSCSYKGELYTINDIEIKLYYHPFVYAPLKKGDRVGDAYIYHNNKIIERLPIEADEDLNYAKQERSQAAEIYG